MANFVLITVNAGILPGVAEFATSQVGIIIKSIFLARYVALFETVYSNELLTILQCLFTSCMFNMRHIS